MLGFALRRFSLALLVAAAVSVIAFALLRLSGDLASALAGAEATPEDIEAMRVRYGLDRPLYEQYFDWLNNALHGDLGSSFYHMEPVSKLLMEHLPVTLTLSVLGLMTALIIAVPLGVLSANNPNSGIDRFSLGLSIVRSGASELLACPVDDRHLQRDLESSARIGWQHMGSLCSAFSRARNLTKYRPSSA